MRVKTVEPGLREYPWQTEFFLGRDLGSCFVVLSGMAAHCRGRIRTRGLGLGNGLIHVRGLFKFNPIFSMSVGAARLKC